MADASRVPRGAARIGLSRDDLEERRAEYFRWSAILSATRAKRTADGIPRASGRIRASPVRVHFPPKEHAVIEIRRILCPVDYSEFSRRALDHAMAIARWYGSTITVLHVSEVMPVAAYAPVGPIIPPALLTPADRTAMLEATKKFAAAAAVPGVALEFEIAEGRPTREILERARALACDLLVLGTHGYAGFDRLALGSVAEKVLRKAECPVLTVPRGVPDAVPIPSALFKHVVCAVDFSASSIRAFGYAVSLAQEADAELTVLHVLELPPGTPADLERGESELPRDLRKFVEDTTKDRRQRLRDMIPATAATYCTVDTVLAVGKPYREILRIAGERRAGLIVLGVHGHGALDTLIFGSTAHHIVRGATCPVLTRR
jgi:nucleotide-binding universal stress UspA family protein